METTGSSVRPGASSSSSSLSCTFLGSLSSPRGRDLLSQLCLKIAQQSNLRHHFVERKDMDKINRQFFSKPVKKMINHARSLGVQQPPEHTMPLEMKVFYARDQLEQISNAQVRESSMALQC
jgi:hypothetical protein